MIEEYSRLHSNPFNLVASYVWGERNSDDIVAMSRGGQTYYYHTDRLGSVVALTNSSGAIVERYSYDAYGIPSVWSDDLGRYRSMGDSAVGNTLLYTGRPYDRIVGLHDMRARQYSANLGRFISRDPIGMADDVNLYAYVANSPLVYVDRFGKEKAALQSRFPYPGDIFNSLLWIDVAGDASPEKTAQLKRMEQADLLLIVAGGAGLVKSLTKSAVRASPAVFDEAAYMKNSMSDAMEAIRQ